MLQAQKQELLKLKGKKLPPNPLEETMEVLGRVPKWTLAQPVVAEIKRRFARCDANELAKRLALCQDFSQKWAPQQADLDGRIATVCAHLEKTVDNTLEAMGCAQKIAEGHDSYNADKHDRAKADGRFRIDYADIIDEIRRDIEDIAKEALTKVEQHNQEFAAMKQQALQSDAELLKEAREKIAAL